MGNNLECCQNLPEDFDYRERKKSQQNFLFNNELEIFFNKYPQLHKTYDRKNSYCSKIDKSIITELDEGVFIGKISSKEAYEGIMLYKSGFYFEGDWKKNQMSGCGRMIEKNGDYYEGQWKNNQPHGQGVYEGKNPKRKYIGEWVNGQLEGRAVSHYEDGSRYEGQFSHNLRHGKGKLEHPDGSYYEGEFKNDQINGFGTFFGQNNRYIGEWVDGKMDGQGRSSWFNQNQELAEEFQGQYKNGFKHGKGEYRWLAGKSWKGEWIRGQMKIQTKRGSTLPQNA